MQEGNYTYRFINPRTGLHYYSTNGVLATSGPVQFLNENPDGWQQYSLKWERNKTDWGTIRGFTIPLKFVTDGAFILRSLFLVYGYEAECQLIINELDPHDRQLKEIFRGDIDFLTIDSDENFVSVNIIEGGLYNLLKANESTPSEIKLNVPTSINVKLDGVNIYSKARYSITPVEDKGNNYPSEPFWTDFKTIGFDLINQEGLADPLYYHPKVRSRLTVASLILSIWQEV
jgi:hypothetical protein